MASLRKRTGGRPGFELSFYYPAKKRRTLWLSRFSQRLANEFKRHVEELVRAAQCGQQPQPDTVNWLSSIDEKYRSKLVAMGAAQPLTTRQIDEEDRRLGTFTQRYIDRMVDARPRTRDNYGQARRWLVKHLGAETLLVDITPEDMNRWVRAMKAGGLGLATRNKHVKRARTFFKSAVSDRIIPTSPASVLRQESLPGRMIDRSRHYFIDANLTRTVLQGLPCQNWRLIFVLLRFQGMRRHEALGLEWQHVDWESGMLHIHSEKTGLRYCPIFPETLVELNTARAQAPQGAVKAVTWARSVDSLTPLLRKRVKEIVGADRVWRRICNQLRSTRRTELDRMYPGQSYIVDEWLGHDSTTARQHYQQVTQADVQFAHAY